MQHKQILLFDLDGTITDPRLGITRSVQYSLRRFGIEIEDADTLTNFIGPPLRDSYRLFYGMSAAEAEEAVAAYREYYTRQGILENTLYPGFAELLKALHDAGRTVLLATSKPTVYAEQILRHFALADCFTFVGGSELDGRRSRKSEVIAYALQQCRLSPSAEMVMIGDKEHDIIGAKEIGIDSIGVRYGYGSGEELQRAGANAIVDTVAELAALLGAEIS